MRIKTLPLLYCLYAYCAMAGGVRIFATTPTGRTDCESPGQLEVTGSLLEASGDSFALNLCEPTQDCSAIIRAEFSAHAPGFPGFDKYLRRPAFIRVNIAIERREAGCAQLMTVANVASWRGARDPSGRGNMPYFAAAENKTEAPGDWFQSVRCPQSDRTLGLRIAKLRATLELGAVREFSADEQERWTGRLLSAGACGSPQGWSFWIAGAPPPRGNF